MTIDVDENQIDFIIENKNNNIFVNGPRCCGLTTMAMLEASYHLKMGFDVSVCVDNKMMEDNFHRSIMDAHRAINPYIYSPKSGARLDIFCPVTEYKGRGLNKKRIIFDESYYAFSTRGNSWSTYAENISIYSHHRGLSVPTMLKEYVIGSKIVRTQLNSSDSCPKCFTALIKKSNEGLLYSGPVEVKKCPKCGYCN